MFSHILNNKYVLKKEYLIRLFSEFFSKSFNFLVIPIITYNLSVIDYGFYVQIICIVSGLIPLVTLGLNFTVIKNLAGNKSIKNNSQSFFSTILFICISCILLLFITFLIIHFGDDKAFRKIIYFIIFLIMTSSLELITLEMLRAKIQSNIFCFLQVLSPLLILLTLILASKLNFLNIANILISFSCVKILIVSIGILILSKKNFIEFNFFKVPDGFVKLYFYPGITFMLIGLSEWIINYSDKLIIGYFLNNKVVSIYYTIGLLSSGVLSIGSIFWWKLYPNLSELKSENKKKGIFKLVYNLNNIFIELVIPVILIISLIGPFLINILLNIDEFDSSFLVFYFAVSILIHQISTGWEFYCYIEDKGKFILQNTLFWGVVSLILNFLLIPKFSIFGAITVLFLTKTGFSISLLQFVKKNGYTYDILNYSNLLKIIISLIAAIFTFFILKNTNFSFDNKFFEEFILVTSTLLVYYFVRYPLFSYLKNRSI